MGNPFDARTLAIVSRQSPEEAVRGLREALDAGLLLPVASFEGAPPAGEAGEGAARYAFLHDRVQQAAYARLPDESRQRLHLAVGRLLLERWDRSAEERIFEIVSHLNLGAALISDPAERLSLARLSFGPGHDERALADAARLVSKLVRGADFACRDDDGSILVVFAETDLRQAQPVVRRLAGVLKNTMLRPNGKQRRTVPDVALAGLRSTDNAATLLTRVTVPAVAAE